MWRRKEGEGEGDGGEEDVVERAGRVEGEEPERHLLEMKMRREWRPCKADEQKRPRSVTFLMKWFYCMQPGLVFDALAMYQRRHGAPPFAGVPGVPWCTCGNCRDMPTDLERKCCGQDPNNCVSLLPHFSQYCLTEGFLRIHRQYREDITVLGQGNRRVIPSCCVWRIRDRFPDPQGHYTGFCNKKRQSSNICALFTAIIYM
uniref:P2X purinoreceptor 7 intracellular domain-containing protein n=1 Tax=Myripristis murdjan TaxID=586833 RepID=A0A667Y2V3_9TELE